jgi:hypothetical protein
MPTQSPEDNNHYKNAGSVQDSSGQEQLDLLKKTISLS